MPSSRDSDLPTARLALINAIVRLLIDFQVSLRVPVVVIARRYCGVALRICMWGLYLRYLRSCGSGLFVCLTLRALGSRDGLRAGRDGVRQLGCSEVAGLGIEFVEGWGEVVSASRVR